MSSPSTPEASAGGGDAAPSLPAPEGGHWSLTRRMALTFALTTSLIITLYGAWDGYLLITALRTELTDLIDHETRELVLELQESDASPESVGHLVDEAQQEMVKPACAYVVRDRAGNVIAQAGKPKLVEAATARLPDDHKPTLRQLLGRAPLSNTQFVEGRDLQVELIVDAGPTRATLLTFLRAMVAAFLVSLVLAALAGWYTAWRGLASLRALAAQARAIDVRSVQRPGGRPRLQLDGAPAELHRLGVELDAMLSRIDAGLGQMRTFTAGLAHELRSPLQNLIGETEVTLLMERDGEEYRKLLHSNLEDLSDLSDAIDNLIAWCRTSDPSRGKGPLESFDLASEARLRLERERRSARRDGVLLEFDATGDTTLVADREACLRVLRNLVANAIAWSPAGATVSVRIDGQSDRVAVRVEDKGPGIPEELGERVFLPFVSGRQQRGKRGGYGLGLAICRSIMDDHGGSLRFGNREQGGARFTAEFPRPAPPADGTTPAVAARADAPRGDVPRTEVSRAEVSRADTPRTEVSRADGPLAEAGLAHGEPLSAGEAEPRRPVRS